MNKETEIRFADLFAALLKAFIPIICIMLIVGMLGGVYGMYTTMHKGPEVTEEEIAEAEEAVTKAEEAFKITQNAIPTSEKKLKSAERALKRRNEVGIPDAQRRVNDDTSLVQRRQEYIDESIYQNLDPFNCGVSRLTFYIKTDFSVQPDIAGLVEDPRTAIAMAYARIYLFDDEIANQLRSIMNSNAKKQYLQELINVRTISERFVEIRVYNNDTAIAENIVQYLFGILQERVKDQVAPHEANVISTYTGYEINWDLYDAQVVKENELIAAKRTLENDQETLDTLLDTVVDKEQEVQDAKLAIENAQIAYEDAEKALAEAQTELERLQKAYENPTVSKRTILKAGVKFGVIGLAAGLILGCLIILAVKLLNGKLHNQSEAKSRYSFPMLGVLPCTKKALFEKTIRKLEGDSLGSYKAETQATAQSVLSRVGDRQVCLVSTLGKSAAKKFADAAEGKLPIVGNILSDAEAVKALEHFDGIVLVEQRGKSRISEIDSEVLRAKALGKEIVGIVLA